MVLISVPLVDPLVHLLPVHEVRHVLDSAERFDPRLGRWQESPQVTLEPKQPVVDICLKWGYHHIIQFRLGFSIINHPAIYDYYTSSIMFYYYSNYSNKNNSIIYTTITILLYIFLGNSCNADI